LPEARAPIPFWYNRYDRTEQGKRITMSTNHEWAYYRLDRILTDDPPIFFRSWRGVVDRLDRQAMTWVSLDSDPVSRYLKNGEVGFDETTRAAIEATIGAPIPV